MKITQFGKKKDNDVVQMDKENVDLAFSMFKKESTENVKEKKYAFSVLMEKEKISFLRNFEALKRQKPEHFNYTLSDAIREGISILKEKTVFLNKRPKGLIPTRRGIRSITKNETTSTSFYITQKDKAFIYDYIYDKAFSKPFTKDDFMADLILALKTSENK